MRGPQPMPRPRGALPRHDGVCPHAWRPAPTARGYRCPACGQQRRQCPHAWVRHDGRRQWSCTLCDAVQVEDRGPCR